MLTPGFPLRFPPPPSLAPRASHHRKMNLRYIKEHLLEIKASLIFVSHTNAAR
jgi:hypothetical protein